MALTKESKIDKIEVVGDFKIVQVRTVTVIKEDGAELSKSYSRDTFPPSRDTSGETQEVQDVCNAVHTQAVKDAYAAHLAAQAAEIGGE
jgi:hypothetical protein